MAQRLDLAIAPGKHLGWFRLGTSMWDIIRILRDQAALIPVVELKYSDENPFAADIVLRLPSNGIELRFEPLSQRLKLIKVDDFSRLRLTYQGGEVSSTKALPTFLLAYKLFGPTYPGEFDGSKHLYTLSYPGLSLVFPIPEKHMLLYQSSADLPLEFPDGTTPVASHMYIYYGADWTTATLLPISTLARNMQETNSPSHHSGRFGEGKAELEKVIAKIGYGAVLQFAGSSQTQKCPVVLHMTTPQDLLADLGSQQPNDYFYNYFHLGLDVLFDGSTHRCKKIVMHTNVPGHFDFQSYKRCPFVLHLPTSPTTTNFDPEAARLPPIAPQTSPSPSPTHQQFINTAAPPSQQQAPQSQAPQGEGHNKSTKKKVKAAAAASVAAAVAEAMEPSPASYSSGDSPRGSPDLLGSSPVPTTTDPGAQASYQRQQPQPQQPQLSGGGLIPVTPEKGITPEMRISMIMALLDPSGSMTGHAGGGGAGGVPNKPAVILNRGSSTQNPFGPTTLNGTDGVVFEAMRNGHVVTVILY
ncbi:hypothetical protein BGZ70_004127 [Mortierella alpina]|uniref:Uncharacterized protein n=1 Tax=Mortierella alpina TaxID=64518 RepID=A0A9P6M4Y2_MORAP|nr:hypothetical protein BGZ70_004127 [Mortierella alpina]